MANIKKIKVGSTTYNIVDEAAARDVDLAVVAKSGKYSDLSGRPSTMKNPNSITIKAGADTVSSYDGSAAKTFTIAASSTAGAFTISDGTTTKTVQLAGKFTDNNTTYSAAKYNTLGLLKPAYTSTGAATLTTTAASNAETPTIAAKTTTSGRYYAVEADKNGVAYVNVPWSNTTYSAATTSAAGLMSAADKTKLNGIASGATKVEASTTNGKIKINGTETTVYTHPGSGTNPHGTTKTDVGLGNVGNFKAVSTVASQGLTDTEKSNARANIGAGTSSLTLGTTSTTAAKGDHTHDGRYYTESEIDTKLAGKANSSHTHDYLGKTTYEWNKEFAAGSNGAVSLGRYNIYDSQLTFDIDCTTTTAMSGKLVIATQNGQIQEAKIFGNASKTLVSYLKIYQSAISNNRSWIEIFCNFPGWSKNKVHIYGVALNSSTITNQMVSVTFTNGVPSGVTSGDTLWTGTIGNDTSPVATTSVDGLMSAADKTKLNGIATGANKYSLPAATSSALGGVKTSTGITNSSGTISVAYGTTAGTACQGNDSRLSDSRTPKSHTHGNINNSGQITATESTTSNVKHIAVTVDDNGTVKKMTPANVRTAIGAGTSNLTLGTTATTAAKGDHTHSVATTSANGLMSKEDKTKLDGIDAGVRKKDGVFFVEGTQTSTTNVWTGSSDQITELYDGLTIKYYLPYPGNSSGATLNINGLGAYPVYSYARTLQITTQFSAGAIVTLTFRTSYNLGGIANYTNAWLVDGFQSYITTGAKSGTTIGTRATAEGQNTTASGNWSHAEGATTTASGDYSHAEGFETTASGDYSHAEGYNTTVTDDATLTAQYTNKTIAGAYGHAEGYGTVVYGSAAHAEGNGTTASGHFSHAEGLQATASGMGSHAEGGKTTASGWYAHAGGYDTTASGNCSHAEGQQTTASGMYAYAGGFKTTASGDYSHAEGYGTIANKFQYVVGKNNADTTAPANLSDITEKAGLFIVGIGTSASNRINGFRVNPAGKVYGRDTFGTSGADYAEYFEWLDGNPDNEDRRGRFVTLEGDKIRYATPNDDYILGVVSADPSVAGDIHSEDWHNRYLKDVFGSKIVEVVEVEETTNEDGEIIPAHTERRWVLNPDYNPDVKYTSREERPEWAAIGIVGKLVVVDDGTCQVNDYCYPNVDGIATASQEKTNYRVMERLDDTHIRIFIR